MLRAAEKAVCVWGSDVASLGGSPSPCMRLRCILSPLIGEQHSIIGHAQLFDFTKGGSNLGNR